MSLRSLSQGIYDVCLNGLDSYADIGSAFLTHLKILNLPASKRVKNYVVIRLKSARWPFEIRNTVLRTRTQYSCICTLLQYSLNSTRISLMPQTLTLLSAFVMESLSGFHTSIWAYRRLVAGTWFTSHFWTWSQIFRTECTRYPGIKGHGRWRALGWKFDFLAPTMKAVTGFYQWLSLSIP